MIEVFDTVEQRSEDWYELRRGIPTASRFDAIMAKGQGKMRRTYLTQLAAERLTGKVQDSYDNRHMARGREQEQDALARYAFVNDVELRRVGLVRMQLPGGWVGCSPDAVRDDVGLVEVKCPEAGRVLDTVLSGGVEHRAQVQGGLWITGQPWCDLVLHNPDMRLEVIRVERDENYIASLAEEVCRFVEELAALEARFGDPQAVLRQQLEAAL